MLWGGGGGKPSYGVVPWTTENFVTDLRDALTQAASAPSLREGDVEEEWEDECGKLEDMPQMPDQKAGAAEAADDQKAQECLLRRRHARALDIFGEDVFGGGGTRGKKKIRQ